MQVPVILIGPMKIGKSTVRRLLSEKLGIPGVTLDDKRYTYYNEIGFDMSLQQQMLRNNQFQELYQYWKPFEAHSVERVLQDYPQCIIDFGAGHSVYEDPLLFERVRNALAPYPNVILLMPSPNAKESLQMLNERSALNINEHFVTHPSNYLLAKRVVYTKGRTPAETAEDIINAAAQQ
ncbi:shikimate kinase [Gordoniibacillus kamchatkensis]|uniref:Shikimate kinase n=1 Tax=Gordoniibacillus kamchatkensis TaxID=1590651 RepID=A0ABR5AC61_9BACL|nr:shikimate kinase [Paenibacillus sp. VKM B-2647]KIL38555.1 shikimate kinase [Paenibacillus sp. VKM B-2647]